MSMSAYALEQSLAYYLTTATVATRPTAWTISLHTDNPGVDGDLNEAAYAGYARQAATFAVSLTDPEFPVAANTALIEYPESASPYTVKYVVVWAGADPLVIQALNSNKTILAGEKAQITPGELTIGGRN